MIAKFCAVLGYYEHVLMFDLASHVSGICLWNIREHRPEMTFSIEAKGKEEPRVFELHRLIDELFSRLAGMGYDMSKVLVSKEAAPMQAGRFTTAQTLIALGKSHAVLDLYCASHLVDVYDYVGVAPATTHAHLRRILGLTAKDKVQKEDIKRYVEDTYGISCGTLDESDAAFLAETFVDVHWDRQIDEQIKVVKRHRRTLKAQRAIDSCDEEIKRLESLKNAK